jgi:hypothetical protein
MTNQASEDELVYEVADILNNNLHPSCECHECVITWNDSSAIPLVVDLVRTEKLKLLAEVRERVVGEKTSPNFDNEYGYCDNCDFQPTDGTKHCLCYYDEKLRKKQRAALTKLEAEL